MAENDGTQDIEFIGKWQRTVGGLRLVIGGIGFQGGGNEVYAYAAGLSERDIDKERCGYGATEKEAVVDFFRHLRPATGQLFPGF